MLLAEFIAKFTQLLIFETVTTHLTKILKSKFIVDILELLLNGIELKLAELKFKANGIIDNRGISNYGRTYPNDELKNYVLIQIWKNSLKKNKMIGIGDAAGYAVQLILLLSLFTLIILPSFLVYVLNQDPKIKQNTKFKKILLFIAYIAFAILSQFVAMQLILIGKIYAIGWLIILGVGICILKNTKKVINLNE